MGACFVARRRKIARGFLVHRKGAMAPAVSFSELPMRFQLPARHVRRVKVPSGRWQRRAVFFLGGIAVGAAAVALTFLADHAQVAFAELIGRWRFAPLILP